MLKEFKFPDVGEGISEGEIVKWLVSEGGWGKEDQPLVEMENDKAGARLSSAYTGRFLKRRGEPGETIQVGAVLVTIETEGAGAGKATPEVKEAKKDAG